MMKVVFVRSKRRRRTISARIKDDFLELRIPFRLSLAKAKAMADVFLKKISKKRARKTSDRFLAQRAKWLNQKYLEGRVKDLTILWSLRQTNSFGICHCGTRVVRISSRVRKMPSWVIDYLIVHELAHLLVSGHGKRFWQLVSRYPKTDLAKGFLRGFAFREQEES